MTGKNVTDLPLLEKHNFLLIFSSLVNVCYVFFMSTYYLCYLEMRIRAQLGGKIATTISRSSSEPTFLLSVSRHSSPAVVQVNCQEILPLLLCVAFTCFEELCRQLSMKLLHLASYVDIFPKYIGACSCLCNVTFTCLSSKSSIKADQMTHFVH